MPVDEVSLERRTAGMKKVQIITDGSCVGNPGPGGWACILRYGNEERELSGSEAQTTNNRMELTAAINGLKALRENLRSGTGDGLAVPQARYHAVFGAVEDKRLANLKSEVGAKPGSVA
jgi:RNase H-like protein